MMCSCVYAFVVVVVMVVIVVAVCAFCCCGGVCVWCLDVFLSVLER